MITITSSYFIKVTAIKEVSTKPSWDDDHLETTKATSKDSSFAASSIGFSSEVIVNLDSKVRHFELVSIPKGISYCYADSSCLSNLEVFAAFVAFT